MPNFTRLIVACEYALDREVIFKVLTLEKDIKIVAQASRPRDVKRLINRIEAELLILDMDMVDLNVLETLSLIRRRTPSLSVLLLTAKCDEKNITEAIYDGSLGYILKSAGVSEFVESIRALTNRRSKYGER